MAQFVIYRHGKNRINQPSSEVMPVTAVVADSPEEAINIVLKDARISVCSNQRLSALSRSDAPEEDWELMSATEFIENIIDQHY